MAGRGRESGAGSVRGVRPGAAALAVAAGLVLGLGFPGPATAQEADDDTAAGAPSAPNRIGAFTFAVQGSGDDGPETRLLVVPDTASTLNEGARLFLRCRGGTREVYIAVTEGNLGDAREGAGGQWRFDRRPWSDLVRWGANEHGTAAFMPPRLYDTYVERAREADLGEIRIVNTAGVRERFVFPMDGFEEGAERLGCFGGD